MLEDNPSLVLWGLKEVGIEKETFSRHLYEAILRGCKGVVLLKEINEGLTKSAFSESVDLELTWS